MRNVPLSLGDVPQRLFTHHVDKQKQGRKLDPSKSLKICLETALPVPSSVIQKPLSPHYQTQTLQSPSWLVTYTAWHSPLFSTFH